MGRGFAIRSAAVVNIDREPHFIANRDVINFQTWIATINAECISFDAVHPESEALVEPQLVDIGGRRGDENARTACGERSIEGCAYKCADTLTLLLLDHSDGFDLPIGADGDQLYVANDSLHAARDEHFTQFDVAIYFCR